MTLNMVLFPRQKFYFDSSVLSSPSRASTRRLLGSMQSGAPEQKRKLEDFLAADACGPAKKRDVGADGEGGLLAMSHDALALLAAQLRAENAALCAENAQLRASAAKKPASAPAALAPTKAREWVVLFHVAASLPQQLVVKSLGVG